jgi:hypothetical protein
MSALEDSSYVSEESNFLAPFFLVDTECFLSRCEMLKSP